TQEHLAGELQSLPLLLGDVRLVALRKPMQEHIVTANVSRQERPIAASFATSGPGHPLLVEEAAKICVDQPLFHLPHGLAQGRVRQTFADLPPREISPLENTPHRGATIIPDTGILSHLHVCPVPCWG